jgi:hypothetical protein
MELSRSNIIPLSSQMPALQKQAEINGYVEQREQTNLQRVERRIESGDQQGITSRRQAPQIDLRNRDAALIQQRNARQAYVRRPAEDYGLEPLPFGQSSAPFLAQQVAQGQNFGLNQSNIFTSQTTDAHQQASTAYTNTRNLTATILGLQGFREKVV